MAKAPAPPRADGTVLEKGTSPDAQIDRPVVGAVATDKPIMANNEAIDIAAMNARAHAVELDMLAKKDAAHVAVTKAVALAFGKQA